MDIIKKKHCSQQNINFSFLFVARLKNCFLYFSQQLGCLYFVYMFYFKLPVLATKEKSISVYYIQMKKIFFKI